MQAKWQKDPWSGCFFCFLIFKIFNFCFSENVFFEFYYSEIIFETESSISRSEFIVLKENLLTSIQSSQYFK